MTHPSKVRIFEVGPRDGLQNESSPVSVEAKVRLVDHLSSAGLSSIEVGSFVSPQWVPQMADTAAVYSRIQHFPGVSYPVLVPNRQGLDAALQAGVREIAVFAAASETFSLRNTNATIEQSLARLGEVAAAAAQHHLRVRGYVSCVVGCPYEGEVLPGAVLRVAERLIQMGCYEISLGDTIGVGTPGSVERLLDEVLRVIPPAHLAVHFHDTRGQALANILLSLDYGIAVVDSSVAGLGGCPYAPGAAGNVATEDVLYMLNGMGIETGVSLDRVIAAGQFVCAELGRTPSSKVSLAATISKK